MYKARMNIEKDVEGVTTAIKWGGLSTELIDVLGWKETSEALQEKTDHMFPFDPEILHIPFDI